MDFHGYTVIPSKHFVLGWMRMWNYTLQKLEQSLKEAERVEKVGKNKFEAYLKGGKRKIIFVKDDELKEIFIITGAEGT